MLENYPSDVLIDVCAHLDLGDVLSFLSVCRSFRKVRDSRYLWITALQRTRTRRELACPVGTDISQLGIDELCHIARHTCRLEKNWNQDTPRVARAIKSVPYTTCFEQSEFVPAIILAIIPGTSLVVLYAHDHREHRLILCDSGGRVPLSSVLVGEIVECAHSDEDGRHLIAVAAWGRPDFDTRLFLRVFSVQYGDGKLSIIQEIFCSPLPSHWLTIKGVFLVKDVVGMIPRLEDGSPPPIHAINFMKSQTANILLTPYAEVLNNSNDMSCTVVNGTPFIIASCYVLGIYEVYRCSLHCLSFAGSSEWEDGASIDIQGAVVLVNQIIACGGDQWGPPEVKCQLSPRGFHTLYVFQDDLTEERNVDTAITRASLWPWDVQPLHSSAAGLDGRVARNELEGEVVSYPGSHDSPWLLDTSPSGTYSLIVVKQVTDGVGQAFSLLLLQYDWESLKIKTSRLDVPFYINMDEIYSVAIEERCGVVYLSHIRGHLFALPYA